MASKGRKTEDVAAAAARTGSADGTARLSSYNLKKQNKRTLFPPFISQKKNSSSSERIIIPAV